MSKIYKLISYRLLVLTLFPGYFIKEFPVFNINFDKTFFIMKTIH